MLWLLSVVVDWLPDVWIVPALFAAALWLYAHFVPGRISAESAEIVRLGASALVALAVWLAVWSQATAACEARVEAATRAETARQLAIVGAALTQARDEGKAAMDAAAADRAALEATLDALDHAPDAGAPKCGLSRRWVGGLPK